MILRLRILVFALTLPFLSAFAQKSKKTDKLILVNLETHIRYLSDDKLEGRQTGTPGEKTAADYISSAFSQAGLQPKGDHNGWLQTFEINEGRQVSSDSYFSVNDRHFSLDKEYFPLAISAVGTLSGSPAIALQESGVPWFLDLKELLDANGGLAGAQAPHAAAALSESIRTRAKECAKKGATALILYNSSKIPDNLAYDSRNRPESAPIPIIYITKEAKRKYLRDESASLDIKLRVGFTEKRRTGHNIIGFLDNGAPNTIIIGTPYSAYTEGGEDSSALHRWRANDNASGVAAVIELARMLKESRLRGNNYLFVAFSGATERSEVPGHFGSGHFVEHAPVDLSNVNYMIDMDRVGRLSDSSHLLTVGGYGSSPAWVGVCSKVVDKKALTLYPDNAAVGSGDHLSFYHRNIPVLFFFTGTGSPGQDKINYDGELQVLKFVYNIVQTVNGMGRVAFTKTNSF